MRSLQKSHDDDDVTRALTQQETPPAVSSLSVVRLVLRRIQTTVRPRARTPDPSSVSVSVVATIRTQTRRCQSLALTVGVAASCDAEFDGKLIVVRINPDLLNRVLKNLSSRKRTQQQQLRRHARRDGQVETDPSLASPHLPRRSGSAAAPRSLLRLGAEVAEGRRSLPDPPRRRRRL